jgi:hypothetical protein
MSALKGTPGEREQLAAEATAKLAEMTASYREQKATPAADRLSELIKSANSLAMHDGGGASDGISLPAGPAHEAFLAAQEEAAAEAGSPVDQAMAGLRFDINESSHLQRVQTVEVLRADGLTDGAIRQLIANEPVSRAEHERVARWKEAAMSDPSFIRSYLNKTEPGYEAAKLAMMNANVVLTSPIKEEATS